MKSNHPIAAFTILELLIVIAIISALGLVASFASKAASERTNAMRCLNSMREVGLAMQLYTTDHSGVLPDTSHSRAPDGTSLSWTNTLAAYFSTSFIARCPSSKAPSDVTYGWNDNLTDSSGKGISLLSCSTPSATMVIAEVANNYTSEHFHFAAARSRITYNQFKSSVNVAIHGKRANYLFVDSHVQSLSTDEVKSRLNAANATFLKP